MRQLTPILLLLAPTLAAQNIVTPWMGSIFADGTIAPGEWDAAPTIAVPSGASDTCRAAIAADNWGLYLAFLGHLKSNTRFPEILLDIAHDRTPAWNADDHWFHVSATCCHHQGAYGVYDDCSPLPSDWSGHPVINPGPPSTDQIEVAIPWWYLGIAPVAGDTIGFAASLTNTVNAWQLWPAGADHLAPDTWGHLVFPGATAVNDLSAEPQVALWPGPATDALWVGWDPCLGDEAHMAVCDATGRIILERTVRRDGRIDIRTLTNGRYQAMLTWSDGAMARKPVVVAR